MSSSLSAVPAAHRRRAALTLGSFAVLFVAVAAVAATGSSVAAPVFAIIAGVVAVLLALMAWGVLHSVRVDGANASVDHAIEQAITSYGGQLCDCGHEHDPDELHITDAPACAHDGTGQTCTHDCQTCVLVAMRRPSPR